MRLNLIVIINYFTERICIPKRFLSLRKSTEHSPRVAASAVDAPILKPETAADYRTHIIGNDQENASKPRPMSSLRRRKAKAKLKQQSGTNIPSGRGITDAKKQSEKGRDDHTAGQKEVIGYVQATVEGAETVTTYVDACSALRVAYDEHALKIARRFLMQKCHQRDPDRSKIRNVVTVLLNLAVATFEAIKSEGNPFLKHLNLLIERDIDHMYTEAR